MGSLFRSEEMRLCQLFLQTEAAYACVSELGELGLVQFKDLNGEVNAFQRKFVSEVRRCEEMERKLRYMEKELHKEEMKIVDYGDSPPNAPPPKEMIDLEATFEKIDNELREVNTNHEALNQNFLELTELKEVLYKTQYYFAIYGQDIQHMIDEEGGAAAAPEEITPSRGQGAQLNFLVGTVGTEKVHLFERVMKYYTHSNVFLRTEEITQPLKDPITGDMLNKHMFIVFFQGEQLRTKVRKVCEGMRCSVYPVPDAPQERDVMMTGVNTRLADLESVLRTTGQHRQRILENVQKEVRAWTIKVEKIKAIFHTLNLFRSSQNSLIAECWCPLRALDQIRQCLNRGEKISGSTIPTVIQPMETEETPPTYYNCNRFVKGFQAIVDAYGVSTYGEVNPATYTCITFPFLFAIMFGDAGHGLIMFLFGAWMCVKEKSLGAKKSSNEIWNTFFGGRYIIMMMGLFSIYTGLVYNDCFARALNIFGSEWSPQVNVSYYQNKELQLNPNSSYTAGTAYFLGVDPIWQSAKNKISFLNSLKMKLAVIIGVTHMTFGIMLSVFNHVHFNRKRLILLQFLPELLFLGCLFGYLVAMVIYKWLKFDVFSSRCAPPLLIHYINMFMFKYKDDDKDCMHKDPQSTFYDGQQIVQTLMFLMAILSVPVLLIVKPAVQLYINKKNKERKLLYEVGGGVPLIPNEIPPATDPTISVNSDEESNARIIHSSYQSQEDVPLISNEELPAVEVNRAYQHDNGNDSAHSHFQQEISQHSALSGKESAGAGEHGEHGEETLGEIIIENVIETIEFCLGCISHTASYLRLWALSLAHAQLSEVLWTMVMHMGFTIGGKYVGGIILFAIFFFWANLTVGILLLMEGLSAFLHTLRLHWVEFQSKFYKGSGYHFTPFNFKQIVEMDSLEDMM